MAGENLFLKTERQGKAHGKVLDALVLKGLPAVLVGVVFGLILAKFLGVIGPE